jgi:hypothetical protein
MVGEKLPTNGGVVPIIQMRLQHDATTKLPSNWQIISLVSKACDMLNQTGEYIQYKGIKYFMFNSSCQ